MRNFPGLVLAAATLAMASSAVGPSSPRRTAVLSAPATRRVHSQAREIARRQRQQARLHRKYMLNGGFSRRGNEVGPIAA